MRLKVILYFVLIVSCSPKKNANKQLELKLWYKQPATIWEEALSIGNGRLGAMVYGVPSSDTIQFNEDTFWAGGPDTFTKPETYKVLPEIRQLVFDGKYKEAQNLVNEKFIGPKMMPFLPMGDLVLDIKGHENYSNYRRELDLRTAITKVEYDVDDTKFTREVFVSFRKQAIIVHMEAIGTKKMDFTVSFANDLDAKSEAIDNSTLKLSGKAPTINGREGKVTFASLLKIRNHSGTNEIQGSSIVVNNASSVDLILVAATNFRSYNDLSRNPDLMCELYHSEMELESYDQIKYDHIDKHQELFNRVEFKLPETKNSDLPTNERLELFQNFPDPSLVALYYQFGRYLLMSSSRPAGQPANLQGLWNNKILLPQDSKYNANINFEMNYWAANSANLRECAMPLYTFVRDLSETGKITAKNNYNANGWVLHHYTDIWRSTYPIDGTAWGIWPIRGAWLCTYLWEYYQYSLDENFLKLFYPVIKESAQFFVETLVEHPEKGWLVTCPTVSSENRLFDENISICGGSFIDNQLLRDLFKSCIQASEILGIDKEFADTLKATIVRLGPNQIVKDGYLQECLEDRDMNIPELKHKHVSHLYGLFPGNQFTKEDTPELWEACRKSLEMQGDEGTGSSLAWKINLWAHLYNGNQAYMLFKKLLKPTKFGEHGISEGTYPNLFNANSSFQMDGNLGAVSGINEMLLQNRKDEIILLPALPSEWGKGSIEGIRAKGGFEVSIVWKEGKLTAVRIMSKKGKQCNLKYGKKTFQLETIAGKHYLLDGDFQVRK
ncbi:glycoside hydrolase family 95 protein [Flavivirga amylovorans]|uniref:Glycoside hydrolase family 95 protein n=1 Tax=Flavivirga amylovorans TaxID=870486 RepID=A0ABT8WY17_9FLAO|nr:glycoside hydrolase family 95 protein [Flavivirga amylovorans]MDO5986569.1 glycoside hydrolase family 95 protein [Flavivirga amylovorans]